MEERNWIEASLRICKAVFDKGPGSAKVYVALKREGFGDLLHKYKDNQAILETFGIDIVEAEWQEQERKENAEKDKANALKAAEEAKLKAIEIHWWILEEKIKAKEIAKV